MGRKRYQMIFIPDLIAASWGTVQSDPNIKAQLKIGDMFYDIDLLKISYLSSFASFQRNSQPQALEFIHNAILLFGIALKGLESGYKSRFHSLLADISQYDTLYKTYGLLGMDVTGGE